MNIYNLLNARDVADRYGISVQAVNKAVKNGQLKAINLEKPFFFRPEAVTRFGLTLQVDDGFNEPFSNEAEGISDEHEKRFSDLKLAVR